MDYEKKYEKLVDAVKVLRDNNPSDEGLQNLVNDNVPELKESEGERIRKELLEHCKNQVEPYIQTGNKCPQIQSWIAWLEKQGEQKQNPYSGTSFEYNGHTFGMCARDGGVEILFDGELKAFVSSEKSFVYPINPQPDIAPKSAMEAIKEEKVDNVEPKFHEGDWVVQGDNILKIKCVGDTYYCFETVGGYVDDMLVSEIDSQFHLWTIEDAKDGDVLHSIGWHNDCIFIFNGLDNWRFDEPNGDRAVATGYCCLFVSADKIEFGIQGPDCIEVDSVKPATREQRDLLFQRMKEAGYEWDAEKKELKKDEQKFTWSEEDEENLNQLHKLIVKKAYEEYEIDTEDETLYGKWLKLDNWLKSLKPQQQWKPSKEQMKQLKSAADIYPHSRLGYALRSLYQDLTTYQNNH